MAYVARGGTLTEPTPTTTFQSVCEANSGDYRESWLLPYSAWYSFLLAPACLWWDDITQTAWETARSELFQFCPVYSEPPYWESAQDQDCFYYGCTEAT